MLELSTDSGEFQWVSPRGYLTILLLLASFSHCDKGGHWIKIWIQSPDLHFLFHIVDLLYPMIFQWILAKNCLLYLNNFF